MTRQLMRVAVWRLPPDLRDEMRTEWSAEMYAITARPGGTGVARGLGFALSLACARPACWEPGATIRRDMWLMLKTVWRPAVLWLFAGPVLAVALLALLDAASEVGLPSNDEGFVGPIQLVIVAVIVAGLVPVGRMAAGRPGLVPARWPVLWALGLTAVGAWVADVLWGVSGMVGNPPAYAQGLVPLAIALAVWAVVVGLAGQWMARLVGRGRPAWAALVAVFGVVVAVNLALILVAWVYPESGGHTYSYTYLEGTFYELPSLGTAFSNNAPQAHVVLAMSPYLLVALAVPALAYRWRIAKTAVAETVSSLAGGPEPHARPAAS